MSVAEKFAEFYVDDVYSECSNYTIWLTSLLFPTELHDVIVTLYWAIANKWDREKHCPVPDYYWITLMEYNLCAILEHIGNNTKDYDPEAPVSSVKLALTSGFEIIADIDEIRKRSPSRH